MYVRTFVLFPSQTSPVNELQVLSDDCRYLVLLAKIQSKVGKKEEALLSLERVRTSISEKACPRFIKNSKRHVLLRPEMCKPRC